MRTFAIATFGLAVALAGAARAEEPGSTPRPVPLTRPEVKQFPRH